MFESMPTYNMEYRKDRLVESFQRFRENVKAYYQAEVCGSRVTPLKEKRHQDH